MDYKKLWQAVLGELEVSLSRANFATWFKNTSIIANENGHVIVAVPNIFTKEWLENKYNSDIKSALSKITGQVDTVEYKVTAHKEQPVSSGLASPDMKLESGPAVAVVSAPAKHNLNPKYTFETFVVGSSNELAYAACEAVAKNLGTKYNPLYIYGGAGLGKTHLMQAVGNEIKQQDPSKNVVYVTSEEFTNEFLSSLSRKKTESFKERYRKVDVLIIDDMQFLAGKEKTQEEFFHIFNALHQTNKQVIISSDTPPKNIATLEERLRSRFEWGMTADIQSPDYETRAAILQTKASSQGITLPMDVVDFLARNIHKNIRELEGALTQLLAHCELRGVEPNMGVVMGTMGGLATLKPKLRPASPRLVIEKTAAYFNIQPSDITGPKRDKEIVVPRQIAMYLMRQELNLSFPKIAAAVGGRDHTTALHSVNKIDSLIEADDVLRQDLSLIKDQLLI